VVLAAPAALAPLVELAGVAERLLDARGLEPLRWGDDPPDLAVNLHGRGPQSHALLRSLDPGRLVAFGCPAAGHPGPVWRDDEHEVRRWCRLVRETLGVAADPGELRLPPPGAAAAVPGAVVVHPGAAYPARRWPADRFAAVARALVEQGYDVVVTGGPDEVGLAEHVARAAGLRPGAVLAGRTDLERLAAQVAGASLLVCGDTGVAHLATAFATPSVLLFGPMPPARWGPPPGGPHAVVWHGDGVGDPWGPEVDPALLRVGVGEVVERSLGLLSRPSRGPRTTPGCA
jgi:glycosyl transferase family 9 (putative heptosyltransferase)